MAERRILGLGSVAVLILALPALTPAAEVKNPTFSKDIAPIFQEKCQSCHRKDSLAPFSLISYEETRPWAKSIKQRVVARQMPPWHLDKGVGIQQFQNDMSLSDDQIQTIAKWVDAGAPQGDAKDMPVAKVWPKDDGGWLLTKEFKRLPDMVIKSEPYTMPAKGQDQWWRPLTDIPVTEPRWVRAVEMRPSTPGGRKVTHHALAHLVQDNDPDAQRFNDTTGVGGRGSINEAGTLMEWAVNKNYDIYREGTGKLLLPGAHVWWDIHYHAVGEDVKDHVELAIWLYPKGEEPKHRTYLTLFTGTPREGSRVDIPPNSIRQTQGFQVLKSAARMENFQPHMHLRGKAMTLEAILPDGTVQTISHVDHFNFNWMTNYIYTDEAAPMFPKGTVIHTTAIHDNTKANPFNPDPEQWVGYGDRTVDEMAHAWVNVTYVSDAEYAEWAATHKKASRAESQQ